MSRPLVVLDADVLGRRRTGDETYVEALLRELPAAAPDLRLTAVTRRPERVPAGFEAVELPARSQPLRMAVRLPVLLRRLRPDLAHFLYVVPPAYRGKAVVTVHDLSFEEAGLMGRRDRFFFRTFVPRSLRRAERILTGSEWTKRDLIERYDVDRERVVVTPYGVAPVFTPEGPQREGPPYALFVGALQPRKAPEQAVVALGKLDSDLRLVFAGPDKGSAEKVRQLVRRLGLDERVEVLGHVEQEQLSALYRGAACLVLPSRYEGFGLPMLEAMASGTPVVAARATSLPEVAGDAAVLVEPGNADELARGIERAVAERERLAAAGLERARRFGWQETARRTVGVYRELLEL